LKVEHPTWTILPSEPITGQIGYLATRGKKRIHRERLSELESALIEEGRKPRAVDRLAEHCMDVIDAAVSRGELPG
jgi:hypothetical protein